MLMIYIYSYDADMSTPIYVKCRYICYDITAHLSWI